MLDRKITKQLLDWKHTRTKQGLLLTGARQVGKTSSIEQFARANYDSLVKIDFVEQPSAIDLVKGAQNIEDLIIRITSLTTSPLEPKKTLLFFDEVQRCGDAITWMRYLAADGRFDVIYSGSLLGVEAYDFRSLPVGTIDILEMFPMDFEEFSWAFGINGSLWDIVQECFEERREIPEYLHNKFIDMFCKYVLVGGMPEAVQLFANTNDTAAMRQRQIGIVNTYREDITHYIDNKKHAQNVKTIYNAMPAQLNKENKRFIVSGIDKKRRFEDMQSDFDWLTNAGVALPVKRALEATFPLGMNREDSYFKFYLNDVGLLFSTFSQASVQAIIANFCNVNFGSAFENVVAQELRAHGHKDLFYFNNKKIGEVDFLLENGRDPKVLPVEVKSGKYSTKHAALDRLLNTKSYKFDNAFVLHKNNLAQSESNNKITYLPIYMCAFL